MVELLQLVVWAQLRYQVRQLVELAMRLQEVPESMMAQMGQQAIKQIKLEGLQLPQRQLS
jgi:hypothetical protein